MNAATLKYDLPIGVRFLTNDGQLWEVFSTSLKSKFVALPLEYIPGKLSSVGQRWELVKSFGRGEFSKTNGKRLGLPEGHKLAGQMIASVDEAAVKTRMDVVAQEEEAKYAEDLRKDAEHDAARMAFEATPLYQLAERICQGIRHMDFSWPDAWTELGMDILTQVEARLMVLGKLPPRKSVYS